MLYRLNCDRNLTDYPSYSPPLLCPFTRAGRLPFHAPKAAGPFVYRLFDQSTKDKMLVTLGTSPLFAVRIFDFEVTSNLRFCYEAFQDKFHIKGVTQLQSIVIGMCNSGKVTRKDDPKTLIQSCVRSVLDLVKQGVSVLDEAKEKEKEKRERYLNKDKAGGGGTKDSSAERDRERDRDSPSLSPLTLMEDKPSKSKEDEILMRQTAKLQMEIFDTLVALRQNDIAWSLLYGEMRWCWCYAHTHSHCHTHTHTHTHTSSRTHTQQTYTHTHTTNMHVFTVRVRVSLYYHALEQQDYPHDTPRPSPPVTIAF
jgi:hypothetical protein